MIPREEALIIMLIVWIAAAAVFFAWGYDCGFYKATGRYPRERIKSITDALDQEKK